MSVNVRKLDDLIRIYEQKSQSADQRLTPHYRQLAEETADFLKELRRREVPLEGVVN